MSEIVENHFFRKGGDLVLKRESLNDAELDYVDAVVAAKTASAKGKVKVDYGECSHHSLVAVCAVIDQPAPPAPPEED
jgi:hypothetical protein